jgi:tetratricopeptide (TPR) repeat protein
MFTGSHKDYRVTQHYQTEMRAQAEQARLAQIAHNPSEEAEVDGPSVLRNRWVVKTLLIALVIAVILIGAQQTFAQGPDESRRDVGEPEPFGVAMIAYREGRYYLSHGDYEQATAKLTAAIEGLPEEIFQIPGYADMHWFLGEAQEGAGLYNEALVSYQRFLNLVGESAAPWTFAKVGSLERCLDSLLIADARA